MSNLSRSRQSLSQVWIAGGVAACLLAVACAGSVWSRMNAAKQEPSAAELHNDPRALGEMLRHPGSAERAAAATALAKSGPAAAPILMAALHDDRPEVRSDAVAAFSLMEPHHRLPALPGLVMAVNDPCPGVRLQAILALTDIGPPAMIATEALQQAAADDDPHVSFLAVTALANLEPGLPFAPGPVTQRPTSKPTARMATVKIRTVS